jgi:Sulfotransferase family
MRHWDRVLPARILRVCYEDVVDDLETSVRRMLEYCGLKFELSCVDFFKTERSVGTASSEQVRKRIFREGLSQWRNYESWLPRSKMPQAMRRFVIVKGPQSERNWIVQFHSLVIYLETHHTAG